MNAKLAATFGLPNVHGIVIADLFKNSPAHLGGLKPGDIITHINDQSLLNEKEAMNLISGLSPGDVVRIRLIRQDQVQKIEITIGVRPKER